MLIAVIGLLSYAIRKPNAADRRTAHPIAANASNETKAHASAVAYIDYQPPSANTPAHVLKINPDAILAVVNGRALKAQDLLPPGASNQLVSMEVCKYLLQRSIDRELIFQTARAQGLDLDESQKQQILDFKTTRGQTGPGLVQDLNAGASEISFESQDAEAFMLQTSLMEKSGASPNVTSEQVHSYYQQHASEFGELPTDENAKPGVWNNIDFQIREKLASAVRSDFQNRLVEYMKQLKANADIQLTSLASFASAQ